MPLELKYVKVQFMIIIIIIISGSKISFKVIK